MTRARPATWTRTLPLVAMTLFVLLIGSVPTVGSAPSLGSPRSIPGPTVLTSAPVGGPERASGPGPELARPTASAASAVPSAAPAGPGPRPATIINPLAGYSREPAPMGIADFGVTGSGPDARAYSYSTPAFEASADIHSMNVEITGHPATDRLTAFELNAMVVFAWGGTNYTYWIQNGLHVNATNREFMIGGAYVWNFSSSGARLSAGELRGNSSSDLASDTYYFIPGCGGFAGQCSTLAWPSNLTGRIVTSVSGGLPYVAYQYNLGTGWVTYDNVTFLHLTGATDLGFTVDGFHATPYASTLFYDAEWVWVGAGGGSTSHVETSEVDLTLDYWNGANFQAVPNAWDFGGDTGETATNASVSAAVSSPSGAVSAAITGGTGSLGVLYNQSSVGSLNVTVPVGGPETLTINGTPTPFVGDWINLTLAAGTYAVSLENYSNATVAVVIGPGATTDLNLSGAGRLTFNEIGLAAGTTWGVTFDGTAKNGTGAFLAFTEANGTYPVSYRKVPGYVLFASAPTELAVPEPGPVPVGFALFNYTVPFSESGLPTGTSWSVDLPTGAHVGDGPTINVSAPNGSTPYTIAVAYEFLAAPASGDIEIANGTFAPISVAFSYRPTYIAGTIAPTDAQVTIGGLAQAVVDGAFNDSVTPGTYEIVASATGYVTQTFNITATSGNVSRAAITLNATPSPVQSTPPSNSTGASAPPWLLIGAAVAIVAVAAVVGALLLRRGRGPPS